jgi:hypothetical protein
MKREIPILMFVMSLTMMHAFAGEGRTASFPVRMQNTAGPSDSAQAELSAPRCDIVGNKEITISCDYTAASVPPANDKNTPRIALNHAAFSFKTNNENRMKIELTFTNPGKNRFSETRSVYLAIDDDMGNNYVRRLLPHVDFRSVSPGEPMTFSERLLIPAFRHGRYIISLWIPDSDPAFQFNATHNFLMDSVGVPDQKSGLNKVATFVVTP